MIYEYAIDPALVKAWAISREIGLAPQFGLDHRRVVADFPNNWEGEVTGALWEHFGWDAGDPDYIEASNHLNALLKYIQPSVRREHKGTDQPWMRQALSSHGVEPFHAILTSEPMEGCDYVITPEVVRNLRNTRWYLPTIDLATKTPEALAAQLTPLLRTAARIILVDPYFEADKPGYAEVLSLLIQRAVSGRAPGRGWPEVTVMTGVGDRERPASGLPVAEQLQKEAFHRCGKANELLGKFIPKGLAVKFLCVAKFEGGDQIHNRLLLTDVGGASIPYGTQSLGDSVFDDITPLFAGQHRIRWRQYGKGEGINVIGSPIVVEGELV